MMNNIALLRRISLGAMLIAVISGSVSLLLLFTGISDDKSLFFISVLALLIGFAADRRVNKLDDHDAGR
jgi:hypothetical protein